MNQLLEEPGLRPGKFFPFELARRPLIRPTFPLQLDISLNFDHFLRFIEDLVRKIIPPYILEELEAATEKESARKALWHLDSLLPRLFWSVTQGQGGTVCASLITSGNQSLGVGRYTSDTLSRWLVPGKYFPIISVQSLSFQFTAEGDANYYFHQMIIPIEDESEIPQIKTNLEFLGRVIPLNIRAVIHARKIMSVHSLGMSGKKDKIQEKLSFLTGVSSKDFNQGIFEQMHHLIIKLYAEEKTMRIKDTFTPLLESRPKFIDRDIFSHIQQIVLLYPEKFTAHREISHITRLITSQYLFRHLLEKENGIRIKIFKTQLQFTHGTKEVLGILVGINLLRENQTCEERHIVEAVKGCLPNVSQVKDSSIIDQRGGSSKTRLFYLEVEKEEEKGPFKAEEIALLRSTLPRELRERVETIFHPTFMPRNEEEVMRNIVILAQQLKYVDDIPQMIISFDTQTHQAISFTIILLRLMHPKDRPLKEILAAGKYKCVNLENKTVGMLRKKYPKEANVFNLTLDKKPFLRKDFSLDLFKARRAVSIELTRLLGDLRDYNGGILSRQHEVFHSLCNEINLSHHNCEFVLENFFYSLAPSLMQSLLSTSVLKHLFLLFLNALEHNFKKQPYFIASEDKMDMTLILVAAPDPFLKDKTFDAFRQLEIAPTVLASAYVDLQGIAYLGLILQQSEAKEKERLNEWLKSIS